MSRIFFIESMVFRYAMEVIIGGYLSTKFAMSQKKSLGCFFDDFLNRPKIVA